MKSLNEELIDFGYKQVHGPAGFHKNNVAFIECLVKYPSVRHSLTLAYWAIVNSKKMVKREDLPISEKKNLWAMTKEYANGRLSIEELKELSLALLALEYYLQ